jgi:dethiobiotin synthetase
VKAGWFITGTDTGVGKTQVATALLRMLARQGRQAVGMKPVASGAQETGAGLRSDDALQLQAASSVSATYDEINPYCFAPAVAPHLAASQPMEIAPILRCFHALAARADYLIVEGVGGWAVPINAQQTMADVARQMNLPVLLVVGVRLGCLNHALLTATAIAQAGAPFAGWIANAIDSQMALPRENIKALAQRLPGPLLATFPYGFDWSCPDLAAFPDLTALWR